MSNSVSLDPAQAFRQMGRFSQAEPGQFVISIVGAAVCGGATFCRISAESGEYTIDFDGRLFEDEELESLFTSPFADEPDPRLRELAVGLFNALEIDPKGITFESFGGGNGWRLKLAKEGPKIEKITKAPWKEPGDLNRLKVGVKGLLNKNLFGSKDSSREEALLTEQCAWAPLKLTLNQKQISGSYNPGKCIQWTVLEHEDPGTTLLLGEPDAKVEEQRSSPGRFGGLLAVAEESDEPPRFYLMVRGRALEQPLEFMTLAGMQGVIAAPDLDLTDDQGAIEPNERFDALVKQLEAEVIRALVHVTSNYDKINELERVLVDWNVKKLARFFEQRGELERAESLLKHLHEKQEARLGPAHADVGETLKLLFEFYKTHGKENMLGPLYGRMLSVLEASGQKTPDLVRALNAQAREAFEAGELDRAEKLAEKALPIAREVLGASDFETAVAYLVLGSVYRAKYNPSHEKGRRVEAYLEDAYGLIEEAAGSEHPDAAWAVHEMAELYRSQRKYAESEPLYNHALAVREKGGPTPALARTLDAIGQFYADQGMPDEAGSFFKRALEIWDKELGPEHPRVAEKLHALVELLRIYARYSDAEPLYQRIVEIRTRALGPDHRDLVPDLCNLALFYQAQGKHGDAEPLLSRAAEILENALGEAHVENAWVLNHLGKSYDEEGRFDEAEAVYLKALEIIEKASGQNHPDLAVTLDCLVLHYRLQDRAEDAEPMAIRALEIREKALGADHPEVATTLATLGEIYRSVSQDDEATPLYVRAVDIRRRWQDGEASLNPSNTSWTKKQSRYYAAIAEASDLQKQAEEPARTYKRFQEAEHLFRRASLLLEQTLGPSHPTLCVGLEKLADLYSSHRKFAGAEELLLRAKAIREESLGPDHPDIIISLQKLLETYRKLDMHAEAEPLAQRWLEVAEQTVGPEHPETARALSALGNLYLALERREEAEPLIRRALDIRKAKLGPDHLESAISLADFYMVREEYQQAEGVIQLVMASREDAPDLLPFLERYAEMLRRTDRQDESDVLETQATIIRVSHGLDFPE